ncbi:hypothetical protein JOM56_009352 [Amanita muscaria]
MSDVTANVLQNNATAQKRRASAKVLENGDPLLKWPCPAVMKPPTSSANVTNPVPERSAATQSSSHSGVGRCEENEAEGNITETRGHNPRIPSDNLQASLSQAEDDTEPEGEESDDDEVEEVPTIVLDDDADTEAELHKF